MRVCIIGSGLSALTLAKALMNENIYVDIAYLNENIKINRSRTIGISKSNFEYLNENIVKIEKKIWKLNKIQIYTENLKNEKILKFENSRDQLFSIIKNYQFYNIIKKNLSNNKLIKMLKFESKYFDQDKYDLIINTDYSNIFAKKYFNKQILKKYNSFAYTTLIEHEKITNKVATQIFTKIGPLAFLPLSESKTSIVYSIHNSKKNVKQNISNLIHQYNTRYKIKKIEEIGFFELKSFNLRSYYDNKILGFGDLLHRVHPLAGQGFNMTIRDIKTLLKIIKFKISLGLPIDSSVNKEFEKNSRHKNFLFSNGIDLVHEFFNFERKTKGTLVSKSVQLLGKNNSINSFFKKIADKGLIY